MRVLLVEDDPDKAQRLLEFLHEQLQGSKIDSVSSVHSALKALCDRSIAYDLAILDMSMPNYDVSTAEPTGGAPENFGGRELLAQMKLRKRTVPSVVVTMFDLFGDGSGRVSLADLDSSLADRYGDFYLGYVSYDQAQESWKKALLEKIKGVVK
jgi:CheY-like chemotaxis protein